ncbi:MAG: hypothetical protein HRT89_20710, partial [Lentisphaeria bacterium]|nr:hypothetical protein [Lentisphaeria bacterium]
MKNKLDSKSKRDGEETIAGSIETVKNSIAFTDTYGYSRPKKMKKFPWLVSDERKHFRVSDNQKIISYKDKEGFYMNGRLVVDEYDSIASPRNSKDIYHTVKREGPDGEKLVYLIKNGKLKKKQKANILNLHCSNSGGYFSYNSYSEKKKSETTVIDGISTMRYKVVYIGNEILCYNDEKRIIKLNGKIYKNIREIFITGGRFYISHVLQGVAKGYVFTYGKEGEVKMNLNGSIIDIDLPEGRLDEALGNFKNNVAKKDNFNFSYKVNNEEYYLLRGKIYGPYSKVLTQQTFISGRYSFISAISKENKNKIIIIFNGKEIAFLKGYKMITKPIIYNKKKSWAIIAGQQNSKNSTRVIIENNKIIDKDGKDLRFTDLVNYGDKLAYVCQNKKKLLEYLKVAKRKIGLYEAIELYSISGKSPQFHPPVVVLNRKRGQLPIHKTSSFKLTMYGRVLDFNSKRLVYYRKDPKTKKNTIYIKDLKGSNHSKSAKGGGYKGFQFSK